jgi:hemolysin activation/secretion protein
MNMKRTFSVLFAGFITLQAASLAGAASSPVMIDAGGQALKQAQESESYRQHQKDAQQKTGTTVSNQLPTATEQQDSAHVVKFHVSSIETNKSAIFSDRELAALTAVPQAKDMTLADLYVIAGEINKAYREKGYPASQAIIPKQDVKNGVVTIRLVEGRYGRFLFNGRKGWREKYILDQIGLKKGNLVNAKKLELALLNFNTNNSAKLRADLTAGESYGQTDCIITVSEPKQWQGSIFTDNTNPDTSGQYRLGMQLVNTNLGGDGERLVLSPIWTRGTLSGIVSFDAPIGTGGSRFRTGFSRNRVKIIDGQYEDLDIRGNSSDLYFGFTTPLVQTYSSDLQAYADYHMKNSYTTLSDDEFIYNTDTNVYDAGVLFHKYDKKGLWYGQFGGSLIDTTDKRVDTDGQRTMHRFNLDVIRQQLLTNNQLLTFRFSGQLTNDKNLPLTEQITLGGLYSMRGFPDSYVSGDCGYYTSLEYEFPLYKRWGLRGMTFLDYGQVINRYSDINLRRELMSTGLGLIYNNNDTYARLIWGVPMNTTGEVEKGHPRLHFYLQYNLW